VHYQQKSMPPHRPLFPVYFFPCYTSRDSNYVHAHVCVTQHIIPWWWWQSVCNMNSSADEFPRLHSRYKVPNEYQIIKYKMERFYFTDD